MTPGEFVARCPSLRHVGAPDSWARIARTGFRTAEQLILGASLDEATRARLLTERRRDSVRLQVDGDQVVLRDQEPLFKLNDLDPILGDGMKSADWIQILNSRVYFFADKREADAIVQKYAERDGAQELLTISPWQLVKVAGSRIQLSAQNAGAIAHRRGVQKTRDTFVSLAVFPDKRPREITVVGGLDDVSVVKRAVRRCADGSVEVLTVK